MALAISRLLFLELLASVYVGCIAPARPDYPHDLQTDSGTLPVVLETMPSPTSCLANVVPMLPSDRRRSIERLPLDWGGTATCTSDTWHLRASASGYYSHGFQGLDTVTFQAWNLQTGQLLSSFTAERLEFDEWYYGRAEDWGVEVSGDGRIPCVDAPHLAFTAHGTSDGEDVPPAHVRQSDSQVSAGVAEDEQDWSVIVASGMSDEVWIWVMYPIRQEAWGPLPAERDAYGNWFFEPNAEASELLDTDAAVVGALGCATGEPVGSATIDFN